MIFAVDELLCGRKTKVLVAWLQRNEFQGAGGVGALLSIGKMLNSAAVAWGWLGKPLLREPRWSSSLGAMGTSCLQTQGVSSKL